MARAGVTPALRVLPIRAHSRLATTLSATSLLPTTDSSWSPARVDHPAALDVVHDHVLRLLGDEQAAAEVIADVAMRAADRARDLDQAPTLDSLLRTAHARIARLPRRQPDDDLAARLAGDTGPTAQVLVRAMAAPGLHGAALLHLTARHGIDLRRAAGLVGIDRATAARARTEASRQVRARLTEAGVGTDVDAAMARLPVMPALARLHELLTTDTSPRRRPLPTGLAWLATGAVTLATIGGVAVGVPRLAAQQLAGTAPTVTAQGVTDGPAARQLATPGDDVPDGGVEQLMVQAPAQGEGDPAPRSGDAEPAPQPTASPEPSPEPSPSAAPPEEEPDDEPSPEPTEEPDDDPIELPLP